MKTQFSVSESILISKECSEEITVANNMVVGVNGLVATGLLGTKMGVISCSPDFSPVLWLT